MQGRQLIQVVLLSVAILIAAGGRASCEERVPAHSAGGPAVLLPIEPVRSPDVPHAWIRPAHPVSAQQLPSPDSGTPDPPFHPIGGSADAPDYCIVSSRRCTQAGRPFCPGGLDYFHVGSGGHPQPLNEPGFQAWLAPGVPVCIVVHGSFTNWNDAVYGSRRMYEWIRAAAPEVSTWPI
jgi:hypothetical protein